MKASFVCIGLTLILVVGIMAADKIPQAEISNGLVKAKLYLPDSGSGFYRGTRFDWSGVIYSLECNGHSYFAPVVQDSRPGSPRHRIQTGIKRLRRRHPKCKHGSRRREFSNPIGYNEAAVGGGFIKLGVGILLKPNEPRYSWSTKYEIVDPGKRAVHTSRDSVEFVHEVNETSGYAYVYRKTVRLSKGKSELVLEHSLKNTGKQRIETPVYAHNFIVMDDQPFGPDFLIKVPFDIQEATDRAGCSKNSRQGDRVFCASWKKMNAPVSRLPVSEMMRKTSTSEWRTAKREPA